MNQTRPSLLKRSLLIDHDLQMPLIFYSVAIAGSGLAVLASFALLWAYAIHMGYGSSMSNLILLSGMIATVAVMIFSGLYFTNKIAGPLHRLRTQMEDVAEGGDPRVIAPREGDLVTVGLFNAYNNLIERIPKEQVTEQVTEKAA